MSREESLFENSLPSLGKSAIPLIVNRIWLAVKENDRLKVRLAVNSLKGQRAEDLKTHIVDFLEHPNRLSKLAGAKLAKRFPDPKLLDLLWLAHCEFVNTDQELLQRDQSAFLDRKDSFKALIASVKDNVAWLDNEIQNANPEAVPFYELIYLASNLPDPNVVWKKHKELIKTKVPKDRARCIATLIACVNDSLESDWLIENLDKNSDWLGPSCFPPLFRMDPELALEHFDKMDHREMYFHRGWFLPDLLLEFPKRGNEKLLSMLQVSEQPWQLADVFSDNEDMMSAQVLDYLLRQLPKLIRDDMTLPNESNQGSRIYRPISMLNNIYNPELLRVLRSSDHDLLDTCLAEWAINHGGRSSLASDLYGGLVLKVLAKIRKSGISKYVNSLLQHGSQYARLDGSKYSSRNPNSSTFELLESRAVADELWDKFPLEQGYAAKTLCEYGKWNSVVSYINKWGLESLTLIYDYSPEKFTQEAIEEYSERFLTPKLNVSIIEVLSFLQDDSRREEIIRLVGRDGVEDSKLATSLILAIRRLGIKDDDTISSLAKFLNSSNNRHFAINALLSNGSASATAALLFSLEQRFEIDIAVCLLNFDTSKDAAIKLIKENFKSERGETFESKVQCIEMRVSDEAIKRELFADNIDDIKWLVDQEHEGSFWTVGAKYDLLKVLSLFDKEHAVSSLLRILGNHNFRDRELYPYLLVELIGDRAIEELWKLVVNEPWTTVRHSIARNLASLDSEAFLVKILNKGTSAEKEKAIELLGFHDSLSQETISYVNSLRRDVEDSVCRSAVLAQKRLRKHEYTQATIQQFLESKDIRSRWQYLELLCEFADVGDSRHAAAWINNLELTPLQIEFLNKKVKDRRKKTNDAFKRSDKKLMNSD